MEPQKNKDGDSAADMMAAAIANFPSKDVSYETVQATLGPLLLSDCMATAAASSASDTSSGISTLPLRVACDRGQVETVRYLLPFYDSCGCDISDAACPDSGNTAAHHAALSGSLQVWRLLLNYHCKQHHQNKNQNHITSNDDWMNRPNHHGDTPLMMACVANAVVLVRHILLQQQPQTSTKEDGDGSSLPAAAAVSLLLRQRNRSNDSALSLACGHGHVRVVRLLLQLQNGSSRSTNRKHAVVVEDDDFTKAQASLEKLQNAVRLSPQNNGKGDCGSSSSTMRQQLEGKRRDVELCVRMVKEALQRRSDAVAQELLQNTPKATRNNEQKKKLKAGKKKTKKSFVQEKPETLVPEGTGQPSGNANNKPEQETVVLTPLPDGTRAVTVQGTSLEEDDQVLPEPSTTADLILPNTTKQSADKLGADPDLAQDAMKALCLDNDDASRLLLLTPHGFAMQCSPAQLDAVDAILQRQRDAVRQARDIQQRLHATAGKPKVSFSS